MTALLGAFPICELIQSWFLASLLRFAFLTSEIQAGVISRDLEVGEGMREESISLNKIKPEKARILSQGRPSKCDSGPGGWISQHVPGKDILGQLPF